MTDLIVYQVISAAGGVDGMDRHELGGTLVTASFDKAAVTKKYGVDERYIIEPKVIDLEVAKREAMAKLNPIDRLALFGSKGKP